MVGLGVWFGVCDGVAVGVIVGVIVTVGAGLWDGIGGLHIPTPH